MEDVVLILINRPCWSPPPLVQACTGVTMIVDDTQLTCTAPAGTGANVSMSIRVNDVDSFNYPIFRYKPPVVLAATSTPTQGGSVTITGQNFGVVGSSNIGAVYIGGVLCRGATVTTPHSQVSQRRSDAFVRHPALEIRSWCPGRDALELRWGVGCGPGSEVCQGAHLRQDPKEGGRVRGHEAG